EAARRPARGARVTAPDFNDWRLALGGAAHLGRVGLVLAIAVAALAIALSAVSLLEERRARWWLLLVLRSAGVAACLTAVLEPSLELRQIVHVANHVAVLVDVSRSMEVRPPNGGASRAERAADLVRRAAPRFAAW